MRILIPLFSPPTGTWGGLTRVLAIQQAAVDRGHEVAFCASGSLAKTLYERGFKVFESPAPTMFGLPKPISQVLVKRSQSVKIPVKPGKSIGNFWLVLTLSGMASLPYMKKLVDFQLATVKDFKPDLIFSDADPGAFITAAICHLPMVSNYASILWHGMDSQPRHWIENTACKILSDHGEKNFTLESLCFGDQVLKIIPSIPELDDTSPDRADVCYVGSMVSPILASRLPEDIDPNYKYIYTYLGTGSISFETVKAVLPKVFPASSEYRCFVGVQGLEKTLKTEGVEFRSYISADALLPYCSWTISHGGQNTIIQSLQNKVPLILFPGPIFERRFNSQKVAAAGAGFMGELDQFTPEWFSKILGEQDGAQKQAAFLGDRIRSYGGAQTAISAIESWAKH